MPETNAYYQPELTLPDILYRAASTEPGLFIGFPDRTGSLLTVTYQELLDRAKRVAAGLFNLGLRQGDKLMIATGNNKETVELVWGCFLLGVVPTILQPPGTFSGYNPSVVKLLNVYDQLGCPYIFMGMEVRDSGELPAGRIKHIGELDLAGAYPKPDLKPGDLAFIQFSSGSTGDPKGVMLTHRNLMVNMNSFRLGLDMHYPDIMDNWMPLFHDMGLIGCHLTPMYSLISQIQIETADFIMNPISWLNQMSRQKITISGCTNFGLSLVLRNIKRTKPLTGLDFSPIKALLIGAEPISVRTMQEFIETIKPFGFRPEAMMPGYGMAEATLAISFASLMKPSKVTAFDASLLDRENRAKPVVLSDSSARVLSEVGVALPDIGIRITDMDDNVVDDGTVGHIQLKGPSITSGYFNNPVATAEVFCGEWLRTGDIGFFFEGHLYISGRFKNIIFKNGRNYFANDLEEMASTLDDITFGKICFGGITSRETGQDKIIAFVAGMKEEKAVETLRALRSLMRSNLGITVDELVLVKSNEIPKTSSGKLQRFKLMQRYTSGDFAGRIKSSEDLQNL
ncbi:MAG: AMP-binding protein [Bacteroidetes bacterium]|nr:AMP-binding protein [Bacteroidota bacterium]